MRIEGLEFGFDGLGSRVVDLWFRRQGPGFRVSGAGMRVERRRFRIQFSDEGF